MSRAPSDVAGTREFSLEIDTSSPAPGRYLLRIRLDDGQGAERSVPSAVVAAAPK